ncbi:type II toxin-antitoxin system RelE family toxin [Nostoc sp.]|uniref:type II toxin-antitoxin system RelE family toxin n=1 Tax=Nostoc sp. TaxID=1180 RepID=UPI002FFBC2AB
MYNVVLSAEAEEIYATADQALAKKVARRFEQLEQNPRFHPNVKPLKGDFAGYYRYRIGKYQVIYQ